MDAPRSSPPRITVFGLGGTIAMTGANGSGVTPDLSARQLIDAVPGLADLGIEIDVNDFRRKPGSSLTFQDMHDLRVAISSCLAAGADGVAVTQGTDTIEESSYLLDLHHALPQPIVVTGAMRNPSMAGADGPANVLAAIQVAASPAARDQGCLVVLADEIHAARRVRKTHSTSGATFQSPNGGPLGSVVEGQPRLQNRLPHRIVVPESTTTVRVGLITLAFDDDGILLEAAADQLDGIVVAAFGVGHVPARLVPRLTEVAARIPVVLATRTGSGTTLRSTYAYDGSERDLLGRGMVGSGYLDPLKARILLHCLLAAEVDRPLIETAFDVAGGNADPERWPWPTPSTLVRS
jgi:L-asparaginase